MSASAMGEPTVVDVPAGEGQEVEVEVVSPGEPIKVIKIGPPGTRPTDPKKTMVVAKDSTIRLDGEELFFAEETTNVHLRPIRRR